MRFSTEARGAGHSAAFRTAQTRAEDFVDDPAKLHRLVDQALGRVRYDRHGPLQGIWASLNTALRLIKAYADGTYRGISWERLSLLVAAVVYLLMPMDLIPDFVVGLGLFDDVALFGWVLTSVARDLEAFIRWEAEDQMGTQAAVSAAKGL